MNVSVGNELALAFGLLFARAGAMMLALPHMLGVAVPVRIRILLALLLAAALMPLASVTMPATAQILAIAILVIRELAVGAAFSFAAAVVVGAATMVGDVVGSSMELNTGGIFRGGALVVNPLSDGLGTLAGLVFFVGGFHRTLILALARSLKVAPLGAIALPDPHSIVVLGGRVFLIALEIGLPLMVPLFILSLAQGVIARLAPQVNILIAAPAAILLAGLALLTLDAAGLAAGITRAWSSVISQALGWVGG